MFYNKIHTRMRIIFLIIVLVFLLVIFKILYIEIFKNDMINEKANELWTRSLKINADRGDILDRNGKVLATSVTTTSIYVIPNQIKNKEYVSNIIAGVLNVDFNEVYKYVNKNSSIELIKKGMDIDSDKADKIYSYNFEGVYLVKDSKRYYPYKESLSHIIGYVGLYNQGLSGIELMYDDYLKGKDGYIKYYTDGKGRKLNKADVYSEPVKGLDVVLTIDIDLMKSVDNEVNNAYKRYDSKSALAIVMDPSSGEILALSSKPGFDPDNYKEYSEEIINRNLPIWQTFEPGSTFKIITLASSIEEGVIDIFKDSYYDSGSINVDGSTLHCWKHGGHGAQTFLQVVENSCNLLVNTGTHLSLLRILYIL